MSGKSNTSKGIKARLKDVIESSGQGPGLPLTPDAIVAEDVNVDEEDSEKVLGKGAAKCAGCVFDEQDAVIKEVNAHSVEGKGLFYTCKLIRG